MFLSKKVKDLLILYVNFELNLVQIFNKFSKKKESRNLSKFFEFEVVVEVVVEVDLFLVENSLFFLHKIT